LFFFSLPDMRSGVIKIFIRPVTFALHRKTEMRKCIFSVQMPAYAQTKTCWITIFRYTGYVTVRCPKSSTDFIPLIAARYHPYRDTTGIKGIPITRHNPCRHVCVSAFVRTPTADVRSLSFVQRHAWEDAFSAVSTMFSGGLQLDSSLLEFVAVFHSRLPCMLLAVTPQIL